MPSVINAINKLISEPCRWCQSDFIYLITERQMLFFGQMMNLPDLKACNECQWREEQA